MSGGRYARGDNALGLCERCSKKTLLNDLQYDGQYQDLLVCRDCWDPKHPQEYLPEVHDPVTLLDPTGDGDKAQNITKISWPPTPGQLEEVTVAYPISITVTINAARYNVISGPPDVGVSEPVGQTLKFNNPAEDNIDFSVTADDRVIERITAGGDFRWGRTDLSASSGKVYFEMQITNHTTFLNIGFCDEDSPRDTAFAGQFEGSGILLWAGNLRHYTGETDDTYTTIASGFSNPATNQIFTVAIDLDANTVSYYQDGVAIITDAAWSGAAGVYIPHIKSFDLGQEWTIPVTVSHPPSGYDLLT